MTTPLLAALVLLGTGLIAGRAGRPAPPPLIIERHAPFSNDQREKVNNQSGLAGEEKGNSASDSELSSATNLSDSQPALIEEAVYICGARTRKGTPCSRRVHGPVRCWQHKGTRPMLPEEKLKMSDKL